MQSTISTLSRITYYLFLWTNEILSPFLTEKPTNFPPSKLVLSNFDILHNLEILPILIQSWRHERHQIWKDSFHTNSLFTEINWRTKNLLLTKPFTTNYESATLLKDKVSLCQNEALWNSTNWSRYLILHAKSVVAGKIAVIQRLLPLEQKRIRCFDIGGYAGNSLNVSQESSEMLRLIYTSSNLTNI